MSLDEFLTTHLKHLEQDQAKFNLMLGLLNRAKANPHKLRLWSLGEGTACAVQTPPHYVVLGDLNRSQSESLAKELVGLDFTGCLGAGESAVFVTESLRKLGIPMELEMPQRIYTLEKPPVYPKCEGKGREAQPTDVDLFVDWYQRFSIEAVPNDPPQERKKIEQSFAEKKIFFWEVSGSPVSMAARTRETKDGSNISIVYTPPELRGKGYAGSATAVACEDAFKEGKKVCFLYTDLRNPISNRVYQKIGFNPWCDSQIFSRPKA